MTLPSPAIQLAAAALAQAPAGRHAIPPVSQTFGITGVKLV